LTAAFQNNDPQLALPLPVDFNQLTGAARQLGLYRLMINEAAPVARASKPRQTI
jgi:hypothetical protein